MLNREKGKSLLMLIKLGYVGNPFKITIVFRNMVENLIVAHPFCKLLLLLVLFINSFLNVKKNIFCYVPVNLLVL